MISNGSIAYLWFDPLHDFTFFKSVNGIEAKGRRHVTQADVATHNTLKVFAHCSLGQNAIWEKISYKTLNCVQKPPAMDPPILERSPPAPPARPPRAPIRCYEKTR